MTNRISPGQGQTPASNWQKVDYQCDGNPNNPSTQNGMDARGVTYWRGDTTQHTLSPSDEFSIQFTCTQPRCYQVSTACIVFFRTYVLYNPNNEVDVKIRWKLNNEDYGDHYIPGTGHGNFEAIDIGRTIPNNPYHEIGQNIFTFKNMSTTATIRVDNIQVVRVYGICCLYCDCQNDCDDDNSCAGNEPCKSESYQNPSGDFVTRLDYPCNLDGNGTRGFTYYLDRYFIGTNPSEDNYAVIQPGDSLQWNFNFAGESQYIYQQKEVAFFNFNQMYLDPNDSRTSQYGDVELRAYLNGSSVEFARYYLSKNKKTPNSGIFPSFDLATLGNYNDSGANYFQIKNMSDVNVMMSTGVDADGINIYRTYITQSGAACCNCQVCVSCQDCQACQSCITCVSAVSCWPACIACMEECQIVCMSCVTGCQDCQQCVTCNVCQSCQPCVTCQDCQTCVDCQMYEYCPEFYYICQGCESCQPIYT